MEIPHLPQNMQALQAIGGKKPGTKIPVHTKKTMWKKCKG